MDALNNWLGNMTSSAIPLATTLAIFACVFAGLCFILGTKKAVEWAKEHVLHIVMGLLLVFGATSWVTSITSQF